MFMEENLRVRQQRAEGTTDFLGSQLEDAKRELDQQDAKLAEFKRKYIGQLPGEDQGNFNMLNSLNGQLDAATQGLNQLQQNRTYIEAMLTTQLQSWQNFRRAAGIVQIRKHSISNWRKIRRNFPSFCQNTLRLIRMSIRLKSDIEQLKKRIQEQGATPHAVVKEQKAGSEPPQVQQFRAQLASIEQAIRDKQKEQARIQQQIQTYQAQDSAQPGG